MVSIPSLTQAQLEILRIAKEHSGEILHLSFEFPILINEGPPTRTIDLIQDLIDLGLIEIQFRQVLSGPSQFQKDSWYAYYINLELPPIRAWELWRDEFIASQEGSAYIFTPGEEFEDFSDVWIEEVRFQATQPSKD